MYVINAQLYDAVMYLHDLTCTSKRFKTYHAANIQNPLLYDFPTVYHLHNLHRL